MNHLTGIWPACATVPGYRYVSPNGEGYPAAIVHCSLYIVHCSYTFSAKEKDTETGYSYFGARYYSSDLSIWLNVDPMADFFPNMTSYVYCGNNPIIYIDKNGTDFENCFFINMLNVDPPKKSNPQKPNSNDNPYVVDEVVIKPPQTSTYQTEYTTQLPQQAKNITHASNPIVLRYTTSIIFVKALQYEMTALFRGSIVGLLLLMQGDTRPQASNSIQETNKEIDKIAKEKGLTPTNEFGYSYGQRYYKKGNRYYSYDIDKHNGGYWKVFVKKGGELKRIGTADKDFNIIKK